MNSWLIILVCLTIGVPMVVFGVPFERRGRKRISVPGKLYLRPSPFGAIFVADVGQETVRFESDLHLMDIPPELDERIVVPHSPARSLIELACSWPGGIPCAREVEPQGWWRRWAFVGDFFPTAEEVRAKQALVSPREECVRPDLHVVG